MYNQDNYMPQVLVIFWDLAVFLFPKLSADAFKDSIQNRYRIISPLCFNFIC